MNDRPVPFPIGSVLLVAKVHAHLIVCVVNFACLYLWI